MSRVGMVVVTYRSGDVLAGLLESAERYEPDVPVVVVDNASPDGPPDVDRAEVVPLGRNLGYAQACNVGAEKLQVRHAADVIAFVNPDVRLRGPSLSQLATELERRPDVGIATGPLIDEEGRRVPAAWGPPSVVRALWFGMGLEAPRLRRAVGRIVRSGAFTSGASTARDEFPVDGFVVGGAMVVRATCFEGLGGFDPGYFMYAEDMDLCRRARDAGWEVWVLPCDPMIHLRGASSPVSTQQRRDWYRQGLQRFAARHLGRRRAKRIDRAFVLGRRLGRVLPRSDR